MLRAEGRIRIPALGGGEMAQCSRVFAALAEDAGLVPSIDMAVHYSL